MITEGSAIPEPPRLMRACPVHCDDPTAFEAVAPASAILADPSDHPIVTDGQQSKALREAVQQPPTAHASQVQAVERA